MAKSKFFRVAVEGGTTDGRIIERSWLEEMAATYAPATFGARVNMEHIKGFSPQPPFNAYGDVLSLKTEEVDLVVGGKTEKRLGLFAEIDATDELVSINKKRQKIYTSIEVEPNFRGTGKAYLMGLAVTDNPASLGTEALSFAAMKPAFDGRKATPTCLFTAAIEHNVADLGLDEPAPAASAADSFFARLSQALGFNAAPASSDAPAGGAQAPAPAAPASVVTSPTADAGTFSAGQQSQLLQLFKAMGDDQDTARKADFAALKESIDALAGKFDDTPASKFTPRPAATGGAGTEQTDC